LTTARRATGIARTRLAALVDLGVIERQWVMSVVSVRGIIQDVARVRVGLGGCESFDERRNIKKHTLLSMLYP
jgi:hypothetical protein